MAIGKKPKSRKVDEDQLEVLISKGGSSPGERKQKRSGPPRGAAQKPPQQHPAKDQAENGSIQNVPLRMPANLLNKVDEKIRRKIPKPSRNYWIMEAIMEKLDKESRGEPSK